MKSILVSLCSLLHPCSVSIQSPSALRFSRVYLTRRGAGACDSIWAASEDLTLLSSGGCAWLRVTWRPAHPSLWGSFITVNSICYLVSRWTAGSRTSSIPTSADTSLIPIMITRRGLELRALIHTQSFTHSEWLSASWMMKGNYCTFLLWWKIPKNQNSSYRYFFLSLIN